MGDLVHDPVAFYQYNEQIVQLSLFLLTEDPETVVHVR